jgi:hypothetical protein
VSYVIIAVILALLGYSFYSSVAPPSTQAPTIYSSVRLDPARANYFVDASVVSPLTGETLRDATVWAVAVDNVGNSMVHSKPTLKDDRFTFVPFPTELDNEHSVDSISVFASYTPKNATTALTSKNVHVVDGSEQKRLVQLDPLSFVLLGGIFVLSVTLGLLTIPGLRRVRYYGLTLLSFSMTVAMLAYIGGGIARIGSTGRDGDVFSLGFASIYKGTYSATVPDEWIFSLTSPLEKPVADKSTDANATTDAGATQLKSSIPSKASTVAGPAKPTPGDQKANAASSKKNMLKRRQDLKGSREPQDVAVSSGFGAPLWVIFMSVIGGCLFTISLLVKQVNDPVAIDAPNYQSRLAELLRHQFYVVFSPVGSIIVYQLMVLTDVISRPVTVAMGAIAAGIAANKLLDLSLKFVGNLIDQNGSSKTPDASQASVASPGTAAQPTQPVAPTSTLGSAVQAEISKHESGETAPPNSNGIPATEPSAPISQTDQHVRLDSPQIEKPQ